MKFRALSALLIFCGFAWHPFHVAVSDIEYDAQRKAIELSQRMFSDDFAEAVLSETGQEPDFSDKAQTRGLLEAYLREHLELVVNGKTREFTFLGYEYEEESWSLWCYVEVSGVRKLQTLMVRNSILMDQFDDQENIIHMKRDGTTQSERLKGLRQQVRFSWE